MTARDYLKKNLNVPNVLTMIRLFLVPVYLILYLNGKKYEALAVFLLASFTDLLDGQIARKYNLITDFGKLMDPFADKVMVLAVVYSMTVGSAYVPPVIPMSALIIILVKELMMMIGGFVMMKKGIVVYSNMLGKVAHCVFIASLVAIYFHDWFVKDFAGWPMTPDLMLLWLAVGISLCAMVNYTRQGLIKMKAVQSPTANES
ncbi:MAG: CDP-alcohol phosphatidyltransferase family protein [Clostridiales bacterium]|nr:CDP-alcohol phosphatidyltransferase family protein [Clostridiales bacterium]